MGNTTNQKVANKWLNVPIIATITRLLCRELTLQNEYLRNENKILKSKINKRIIFTGDERRMLVDCYTSFFNEHRPHQGIDNRIPAEYNKPNKRQGGGMSSNVAARNITRKDFLGRLLKSYRRAA